MTMRDSMLRVLAILLLATGVAHARPPAPSSLLTDLGFPLGEQVAVDQGSVAVRDLPRQRNSELAAAAAVLIPAPLKKVEATLINARNGHEVRLPLDESKWRYVPFAADEGGELDRLKGASPGMEFNLSIDEIAALKADGPQSEAYRKILIDRIRQYADRGLAGIQPYARGNGRASSPAAELRLAATEAQSFMSKYFPSFAEALTQRPSAVPEDIEHRYTMRKSTINGRPGYVLTHDMIDRSGNYCIVSQREFFVGHTYNSLHGLVVLLEARGGTMAVSVKRTFTDRVAGPLNGFEREMGQKMVRKALAAELAQLRDRSLRH